MVARVRLELLWIHLPHHHQQRCRPRHSQVIVLLLLFLRQPCCASKFKCRTDFETQLKPPLCWVMAHSVSFSNSLQSSATFLDIDQSLTTMLPRLFRGTARLLSTEAAPYPFSTRAITPAPPYAGALESLRKGKGLMQHLHKTLPTPEKQELLATLFSHNHPSAIRPGSVLRVTMEHAPTSFAGVMLAVRRRGVDTSFVLRNIVQGTGVEMQFFVNSPHLKNVEVIRDHTGKRKGRRVRRAKLYYLRDAPDKMTAFASGVTE